jgi:hypothetical protein
VAEGQGGRSPRRLDGLLQDLENADKVKSFPKGQFCLCFAFALGLRAIRWNAVL